MFRTNLLSIIRSLNTVFTAKGVYHTSYVDCLLADKQHNLFSSSSVGATARCGLWPVEQYLSIFPYLSPTLSIFSLPTFEDLFLLLLSILSWVFLFVSSLPVLK
jgi:hypothetical protein